MRKLIPIVCIASVSACQKEPSKSGENAAEPAATIRPVTLLAGKYRQDTTLLEFADPSLPPEYAASAAKAVGTTQIAEQCVTPEMISQPKDIIATNLHEGCKTDRLVWENGKIDVAFSCPPGSEFAGADASIAGSYRSNSYTMELRMADASGKLAHLKVDAKRLGDC